MHHKLYKKTAGCDKKGAPPFPLHLGEGHYQSDCAHFKTASTYISPVLRPLSYHPLHAPSQPLPAGRIVKLGYGGPHRALEGRYGGVQLLGSASVPTPGLRLGARVTGAGDTARSWWHPGHLRRSGRH